MSCWPSVKEGDGIPASSEASVIRLVYEPEISRLAAGDQVTPVSRPRATAAAPLIYVGSPGAAAPSYRIMSSKCWLKYVAQSDRVWGRISCSSPTSQLVDRSGRRAESPTTKGALQNCSQKVGALNPRPTEARTRVRDGKRYSAPAR